MQRCSRCCFVRYCSNECQASAWRSHKGMCNELVSDSCTWDYFKYKAGHTMFYGPVDQYSFELTRHIGMHSHKVNICSNVDLSVPHKLMMHGSTQ